MKVVVVYYGRFQPVHLGHVAVYRNLVDKFGRNNVYIGTSNKTDSNKSPLPFNWKKKLWMNHNVPGDHIIQTTRNYNVEEIKNKLRLKDFKDFVFIVAVGQKDKNRLGGRYFKPLKGSLSSLKSADENGYYYVIPNVTMGGRVLSATAIRNILKQKSLSDEDVSILMKQTGLKKNGILQLKKLFEYRKRKDYWHFLLTEGGAAGHLLHPFEDLSMTFGDIKDIIEASFAGKLQLKAEGPITEKVDGQNLFASVVDGKVKFARNKTQLKNRGQAAMSISDMASKWKNVPQVAAAFTDAAKSLKASLGKLPKSTQEEIFGNGERWVNFEVISHKNPNVINYDKDVIIFHDIKIVDKNGNVVSSASKDAQKLFSIFSSAERDGKVNMQIQPPKIVKAEKDLNKNFAGDKSKLLSDLNRVMSKQGMKNSNTLGDYLTVIWKKEIEKLEDKHTVTIKEPVKKKMLNRLVFGDKSYRLTQLPHDVQDAAFVDDFKKMDKEAAAKNKIHLQPIENVVLKFGVLLLKNIDTFIAASPNKSVEKLRSDINKKIAQISSSKNVEDVAKMTSLLQKIDAIGGFDNLVPTEGIVFRYKNKLYKLTGLFAPVNQLMGIGRFG